MKKNKVASKISKTLSRIFKVRYWTDYDRNKNFFMAMLETAKRFLIPVTSETVETFDEARVRLKLTDDMILMQKKSLFRLSLLMACFGCGLFIYAIYQLVCGAFLATLVSLMVMAFAFVLGFRYHFLYFQIEQKKLGCSLHTWFHQGLLREKP
ncbi:MAG: type IVB secretion system protein IcmV [Legionellaceae bacterium]